MSKKGERIIIRVSFAIFSFSNIYSNLTSEAASNAWMMNPYPFKLADIFSIEGSKITMLSSSFSILFDLKIYK